MLLFFGHWPSYSNCWNQTSNVSIFVMQTEEVIQQRSINRKEGQDSGRGSTEEGEATRRPAAGGHTEAQQGTVWQWSTQTQSMFHCCIIVMRHSPTAKVLHSGNGTYIYTCISGAYSHSSQQSVVLLKWYTLTIHPVTCWIKVVHTHSLAGEMLQY